MSDTGKQTSPKLTPDQAVASRIVKKIEEAGLVSGKDATTLMKRLAQGQMQSGDWKLMAEPRPKEV